MPFLNLDPGVKRKDAQLKELPSVPNTGWKAPDYFPDLRDAILLSVDTETKDRNLLLHGPGWGRKQGHIVGISIAALGRNGEKWKGYYPIRHEVHTHENCDVQPVLAWAKDMLETPIPKTGANLFYDVGWLAEENIFTQGPLYDIQYAEALLDEQGTTNLDFLANKYLGRHKATSGLYEWCAKAYGGTVGPKQRANIYRAPPSLVGFYGEADAVLPLDILPQQWAELAAQGLTDLYVMECKLTRLLVRMRREGVRVDLDYAQHMHSELGKELREGIEQFAYKYGRANYNSTEQLAPLFLAQNIPVPKTEAGGYSIVKAWLEGIQDEFPIAADVLKLREYDKLIGTFLEGYVLKGHVNGRLHCSFNPLRTDKGGGEAGSQGAKTGRFSSSDPNLQNIPVRSKVGKRIRKIFIPDVSHLAIRKYDYSQIEYRMLAHFATDNGDGSADALRQSYIDDPDTDYHDYVYDAACPYMGWDINDNELRVFKRRPIKNTNFGLVYGQGQGKLARTMHFTPEQARTFFTAYHTAAPYVKPTMQACADEVHQFGYVRTILGRRTRFDLWQPYSDRYSREELPDPLSYDLAIYKWGSNIKRAYDYRAVNYKFQGSAADQMKTAMVRMDESGVFDTIGVPKLTVHDELVFSQMDDSPRTLDAFRYMQHLMETAIPLRVPVRADPEIGPNWGECQ